VNTPRRTRGTGGQAAVEFALCLPLVAVMALGVLQVLVVARDQLRVEFAARDAARAAAVATDAHGAARAAATGVLGEMPSTVTVNLGPTTVTVTVSITARSSLPLVGAAIREIELSARATMLLEPPDHLTAESQTAKIQTAQCSLHRYARASWTCSYDMTR
jgi:Flp pilus assembly protein TadG